MRLGFSWASISASFFDEEKCMHIEPGLVDAPKIVLSYATATGAVPYGATRA